MWSEMSRPFFWPFLVKAESVNGKCGRKAHCWSGNTFSVAWEGLVRVGERSAGERAVVVVRVEGGVRLVEGCGVAVKLVEGCGVAVRPSAREKVASDPGFHRCYCYWYSPERTGTSCDTGNTQLINKGS